MALSLGKKNVDKSVCVKNLTLYRMVPCIIKIFFREDMHVRQCSKNLRSEIFLAKSILPSSHNIIYMDVAKTVYGNIADLVAIVSILCIIQTIDSPFHQI